jgi:hypothetical protein
VKKKLHKRQGIFALPFLFQILPYKDKANSKKIKKLLKKYLTKKIK